MMHVDKKISFGSLRVLSLFFAALLISGCGKKETHVAVFPVSGKLLVQGRPAAEAIIYFRPETQIENKKFIPIAQVTADGSFKPTTFQVGDGLPEGKYDVTVAWITKTIVDGEPVEGADKLGGKYANPAQPMAKIEIKPGENKLSEWNLK